MNFLGDERKFKLLLTFALGTSVRFDLPEVVRMNRSLILIVAAGFCLTGCHRAREESRTANSPQMEQMVTALRESYAAFNRGDIDAALEPLDAQIEWSEPAAFPGGGAYHGRNGVKQYLTQSRATWAEGSSEPEQFITVGDKIVVFVHARIRQKGSNAWQDVSLADVYTVRNGKATQMRAFADRQEALRSVGVRN
jgi:ketosteroid isomerase-like protein